ncbi:hypothetical protein FRC09_009848 [Ceratobasidium sp. 395]|nr:hypothetical protein FRC09_009848 [Ceratobasidium sp. 395]
MSVPFIHDFPEEDFSEGGDEVPGYFRAWLGMQLDDGRSCIVRKLGWGAFSTVWLVRDFKLQRYAALKIMSREATSRMESGKSDEIAMLEKLQASPDPVHKGRRHLLKYYETFKISGPEGAHQCIVTEVLGMSIDNLRLENQRRLPVGLVKTVLRQALLGLDYLHTCCGIVHTDIKFDNILLRLADMPTAITRAIATTPSRTHEGFGSRDPSPYMVNSQPITVPLDSLNYLDSRQVEVAIADLGHAQWSHCHFGDDIQPIRLRAPEVILGHPWDQAVDVWSIGCLTIELLTGTPLFEPNPFTKEWTLEEDHLAQMTDVLGEQFPADMLGKSRNQEKLFKDGIFVHSTSPRDPNWHMRSILTEDHSIIKSNEQEIDAAYDFLSRCLRLRPEDRSAAKDLAEDPWLNTDSDFQ